MTLYVVLTISEPNMPDQPEVFTAEAAARAAVAEYVKGMNCETDTEGRPDAGGELTYCSGESAPAVWLWLVEAPSPLPSS